MSRAGLVLVLAAQFLSLPGLAGTALAQQVDPDSPAGVEYALPHEEARRQADPDSEGGSKPAGGGSDATPGAPSSQASAAEASPQLFGAGVTPKGEAAKEKGKTSNGASPYDEAAKRSGGFKPVKPEQVRVASAGDGSSLGWSLGAAVAVLLLGGLVALVVRQRARRT